jgi:hypothetical protein
MLKRLNMSNFADDFDDSPLFKGPDSPDELKAQQIERTSARATRHFDPLQRFLRADATKPHSSANKT